ncbi:MULTISPECIES: DsbA family protein [unclassified Arthrobacter]|uniref:DsbA family protein n=1 Tax=unclassified Arthrobacter TaxID=235627 RepID=UPI000426F11D|nr:MULTISPECIES: DsbA family protein [unclassified Arthrobacter]MBE0010999.1 DsbA family protein [Arthrobacter sp. AET 35A]PVE15155.1 disulfide bond formation protein [Arthrobacter sp. Bz4]
MPQESNQRISGVRTATLIAALLVGALILVIGLIASQRASSPAAEGSGVVVTEEPSGQEDEVFDLSRRIADDPLALGAIDAPVVLVEYADYRCPFCGVFSRETLPALVDEYVASGELRIEWRDLPVFGAESHDAAVAGRAAGEQDKFWEFNEAVFAAAPERGHISLPREELIRIAEEVGVADLAAFTADLDSEALEQAVQADAEEAAALGATGTPLFLVNDIPISGAQPLEVFEQTIDAVLAETSSR